MSSGPEKKSISRRRFLFGLGAAGIFLVAGKGRPVFARDPSTFHVLVVGDSLIWGQGLEEHQKFYYLTKEWLESEVLNGVPPVHLNVRAHSGSTIRLNAKEKAALDRAQRNGDHALHPEVNVSFPTIERQIELAGGDYADPGNVDLVMLSGGIPDVGVAKIINPLESNIRLLSDIELYCYGHMSELLAKTAGSFPNSVIAVIGYYPLITRQTPMKRIVNDILELYRVPRWLKPLINNPVKRNLWRLWRGKMIRRSEIWHARSNEAFQRAVDDLNGKNGKQRAVFVQSPISEGVSYGTKGSLLYTVGKGGKAADPIGSVRWTECNQSLPELRRATDLKYSTRFCELASVGHPNPEGSRAYAESIKTALKPLLNGAIK